MASTYLPGAFTKKFTDLLGPDAPEFFEFSKRKLRKCFRVNPLKATAAGIA